MAHQVVVHVTKPGSRTEFEDRWEGEMPDALAQALRRKGATDTEPGGALVLYLGHDEAAKLREYVKPRPGLRPIDVFVEALASAHLPEGPVGNA